ncbi:uncharacterized protein METZ01_LOCUS517670, partial [marine metagenome]
MLRGGAEYLAWLERTCVLRQRGLRVLCQRLGGWKEHPLVRAPARQGLLDSGGLGGEYFRHGAD